MGSQAQFLADVETRNAVTRIALRGELDMATVPILQEHLAQVEGDGIQAIMLDLRNLDFVDSSGLRAFLEANERAVVNGHALILVGASEQLRALLALTRTEFLVDEQEAVSVLDQFTGSRARRAAQDPSMDGEGSG